MTTSEFMAWGVPSILVPLPTSAEDHQTKNAVALEEAGVSLHMPQKGLDGATLWGAVRDLFAAPERVESMASRARERARPEAVHDIASSIAGLLPGTEEVHG